MKKTSIFAIMFFLVLNAKAQQIDFGLKGGLNISTLHDNLQPSNLAPNFGGNLGFLVHIQASGEWALQPEFMYSLEGGKSTIIPGGTAKTNLNNLDFPVLLQYILSNGLRLEGGPQIDFILSAKTKINNANTNNNFKSTAFSIPFGVSYVAASGLGFDARYAFGLSNINNQNNNNAIIQDNVFQLGIFYLLKDNLKRSK